MSQVSKVIIKDNCSVKWADICSKTLRGLDIAHPAITLLFARTLGQFQVFIMVHQKSSVDHFWICYILVCGQRKTGMSIPISTF